MEVGFQADNFVHNKWKLKFRVFSVWEMHEKQELHGEFFWNAITYEVTVRWSNNNLFCIVYSYYQSICFSNNYSWKCPFIVTFMNATNGN